MGARAPRRVRVVRVIGELLFNSIVTHVPNQALRLALLRLLGARIGTKVRIFRGTQVMSAENLVVGDHVAIGFRCLLDARTSITIGHHTVIASDVHFIGGHHDLTTFETIEQPISIGDYCWIASRATILDGVTLGRGAVVSACSMVGRDVAPMAVVLGNPARNVGVRESELAYETYWQPWFH